jgi:hypothetical protein
LHDAPALSQRVKTLRAWIQHWGNAVTLELFVHRQFAVKRENIGLSSSHLLAHPKSVSFIAYCFGIA